MLAIVGTLRLQNGYIEATDEDGETPLYHACHGGRVEIAEMLFARGANIEATNKYGGTLLHKACYWGRDKVAES